MFVDCVACTAAGDLCCDAFPAVAVRSARLRHLAVVLADARVPPAAGSASAVATVAAAVGVVGASTAGSC